MKRNDLLKIVLSLIVSIILVFLLMSQITLSDIIKILTEIPFEYLLAAFFVYITFNLFRALRFQLLVTKISFWDMLLINFINGFLLNVMPSRTGDLSYLYLLKKKDVPLRESLSTLLVARIFDIIALAALFLISVLMLGENVPSVIADISVFVLLLLILLISLVVVLYYGVKSAWVKELCKKFLEATKLRKFKILDFIANKFSELADGFAKINIGKKIFELTVYSLCIWVFGYINYFVLMEGIGIHLSIWTVFIGAAFVALSSLLPVQGLAGFGVVEGAWAIAFFTLGVPKELAIASGFVFHIIRLIFATILGVISFVILKFLEKNKNGRKNSN